MKYLALLLLASCSLIPDEVAVVPEYGEGDIGRNQSREGASSDYWAVSVELRYNLNQDRSAMWRNLGGNLDVDRMGRLQVHDHEAHTGDKPAVTVHTGDTVTEEDNSSLPISVDDLPTTLEGGLGWLLGSLAIIALLWVWNEIKLKRPKKPKPEE